MTPVTITQIQVPVTIALKKKVKELTQKKETLEANVLKI
jgi:hypothetical protein